LVSPENGLHADKIALAGSELALIANVSGYLMVFPTIQRYATFRQGLLFNRLVTIIAGMGCYWIPIVGLRLLCISLGTSAGWLALFGNWARLRGSREMLTEGKSTFPHEMRLMSSSRNGLSGHLAYEVYERLDKSTLGYYKCGIRWLE